MKTQAQATAALARVRALIDGQSVAMLTRLDDDGALVSRPMTPQEMDAQGAIWFFTDLRSPQGVRLRVASLAFVDAAQGIYVSLAGHGEIDTDRGRIERLWTARADPWFPDGPDSPQLALLKFVPASAEYWDASGSATTAPIVAGRPAGLGDHETLADLSPPAG